MIEDIYVIGDKDVNLFVDQLTRVIIELQDEGCKVEIKYSKSDKEYSALVIGRK